MGQDGGAEGHLRLWKELSTGNKEARDQVRKQHRTHPPSTLARIVYGALAQRHTQEQPSSEHNIPRAKPLFDFDLI